MLIPEKRNLTATNLDYRKSMNNYRDIILERSGPVTRLIINRPDRLNSLRLPDTRDEMIEALNEIENDQESRVVIITGSGEKAFCTGWDMESIENFDLAELEAIIRSNLELYFKIWNLRQPVIAAINGYALAAGAALALVCDLAIASEDAQLGEPEIRQYALSPMCIMPFLTHSKFLHEYYYTGDMVDAATMLRLGLVNRVVAANELEAESNKLAQRIAKVPAHPLEMTKRSLRNIYDAMGFSNSMRQHILSDTLVIGADLPEQRKLLDVLVKEGMRAFLEMRDGPFRNED
jgi:enoyl-CoA hydratase/carnithine racemase